MDIKEFCEKYRFHTPVLFNGEPVGNEYQRQIGNYYIILSFAEGTKKAVSEITIFKDGSPSENYCHGYRTHEELEEHIKYIEKREGAKSWIVQIAFIIKVVTQRNTGTL